MKRVVLAGGWRGWIASVDEQDGLRAGLETLVANPAGVSGRVVFKTSGTVEVFGCRLGDGENGLDVVCKRSLASGWRARLAGVLRGSRERRNWDRANALVADGIPTAGPIAYLERGWWKREGWLITEAIDGVVDLDRVLGGLVVGVGRDRRRVVVDGVVRCLADLFERLVEKGWRHRDFKASNVLLTGWDAGAEGCRAWLVDLDGLEKVGRVSVADERRMVVRLAASLSGAVGLSRADRCRFLRRVCGGGDWKSVWREVQAAVGVYNAKAKLRKRGKIDSY